MPTREYTVQTGEYMRVHLFPVRRKATGKRGKRNKPTSEVQQKLNARNAENKLADLIHLNFTPDDLTFDLTYRDGQLPATVEDAQREARNMMRRCRYQWGKLGKNPAEFKYIFVTEQSSKGRIHHHCIISGGIDRDTLEGLWRKGHCNTQRLQFDENGIRGKAHYITKEPITSKRWCASQNLAKPAPRQNDYRIKARDARHINDNPDDFAFIEKLYPEYSVAEVRTTANTDKQIGAFVTLFLYKTDNRYFRRTKCGIDYRYRKPRE